METEISENFEIDGDITLNSASSDEQKKDESTVPQMSKRQMKKQQKTLLWESKKKEKRKQERQKAKEKAKMRKLNEGTARIGPSRKELKLNKVDLEKAPCSIAIDLSFDEFMTDKDSAKCVKQLLRIYTANRRAKNPIPLHFVGLKESSKVEGHLKRNEGYDNWDVNISYKDLTEVIDKDKIVYLSSESDNVLEKLDKDCVYVIGGLVDHNQHKGMCHELANKLGFKHARLPLSENIVIKTRTVLTINQVFEILLGVSEGKSWQQTLLQVLPMRKGAQPKDLSTGDDQKD